MYWEMLAVENLLDFDFSQPKEEQHECNRYYFRK